MTVNEGSNITFSAPDVGTPPTGFQWLRNGVEIGGATGASHTVAVTAGDDGAQFSVRVSGAAGSVTSGAATLSVVIAPRITAEPVDAGAEIGASATFSVVVTGTGPFTYQWLRNGVAITGATAASHSTPPISTADSGARYTVRVGNGAGNVLSVPATLTVSTSWPIAVLEETLLNCYRPLSEPTGPYSAVNHWLHGSVRAGDANKGARITDAPEANAVQRFEVTPASPVVADLWRGGYEAIERCNAVLRLLDRTTSPEITAARALRVRGEARFLRGYYHFNLRRLFGAVPYIDETMTPAVAATVTNAVDIYPAIEADFQFGNDQMPVAQAQVWRVNKWAAAAFLAKVKMTRGDLAAAKPTLDALLVNGTNATGTRYALAPRYGELFTGIFAPGLGPSQVGAPPAEIIFGATAAPPPSIERDSIPFGCCGFFQPSFDLVNGFRTSAFGLPVIGGVVSSDAGLRSSDPFTPDLGNLDPRLDHAVGRRGIPFVDWGLHPGADWVLAPTYGGPYLPKKYVMSRSFLSEYFAPIRGLASRNQPLLRFADIMLLAAEAEVEIGSLERARELVNVVRARAANPQAWIKLGDGSNAANYVIGLYNTPWTDRDLARNAVRTERRLELSGEGERFHDLVRWGVAAQVINAYLQAEGARLPQALGGASFTAGRDERYPIPQAEIAARAPGVLQQNPGY